MIHRCSENGWLLLTAKRSCLSQPKKKTFVQFEKATFTSFSPFYHHRARKDKDYLYFYFLSITLGDMAVQRHQGPCTLIRRGYVPSPHV